MRLFEALRPLALRKLELPFGVLEALDVAAMVEHLPRLQVRQGATAQLPCGGHGGRRHAGVGVQRLDAAQGFLYAVMYAA